MENLTLLPRCKKNPGKTPVSCHEEGLGNDAKLHLEAKDSLMALATLSFLSRHADQDAEFFGDD